MPFPRSASSIPLSIPLSGERGDSRANVTQTTKGGCTSNLNA